MVTVTDYKLVESEEGDLYVRLILTGDIAMVQSSKTGNFYATARRCSISATFDEAAAEQMLGKQIPGNIIKQECKPYSYETDSGELIEQSHRWVYTDKSDEELAISELVTAASKNGTTEVEELA